MPYLFGKAIEARDHGWPVMRAMILEFPDDPACHTLDRQYMLGDSLLVAPVFSGDGEVTYYVPEGTWTDYFTGKEIVGGRWITEKHGYLTAPLLIRPNTVLPVGANNESPDYDYGNDLTIEIYATLDSLQSYCEVATVTGEKRSRIDVNRSGNNITIMLSDPLPGVKFRLVNISNIHSATECSYEKGARGILVVPQAHAKSISIDLEDR
jgi:alpha-D-xyloside xylohydrolase